MASLMLAQELSRLTQDVGEEGAAAGQQPGGGGVLGPASRYDVFVRCPGWGSVGTSPWGCAVPPGQSPL